MKPSDDLIVSSTEPTGLNRKKVWLQKGKNLFNKGKIFTNAWINDSGNISSYENQNVVSELISCKPNTTYTVSGYPENVFVKVASYNKNRKYINVIIDIQSSKAKQTFTTGNNDCFIRIGYGDSATIIDSLQLEQGSIATEYEEYIEPKIYVRNDNNVYEEFIQEYDSGWLFLTEVGESYAYIKYRKVGKRVELISPLYSEKGFSISAFGTTLLGTLPEGFRPSQRKHVPIVCKNTSNLVIDYCFVDIQTDGSIILTNITDSSDTAVCLVYFSTTFFVD